MDIYCISLNNKAREGMELTITDQKIWESPLREFQISCRIIKPLIANVSLLAHDNGCLLSGKIEGKVSIPCSRCLENTEIIIQYSFKEFEEFPQITEEDTEEFSILRDNSVIFFNNGEPCLNLADFLWEEFSLALPVHNLCKPDCLGLCPICGKNLNLGDCGCQKLKPDPRMSIFRQIKIKK